MSERYIKSNMSDDLKELLASVDHTKPIKKDTFLFSEGEKAEELYIIKSGKIQIGKLSPDGRELTLRICNRGDIVGELSLYDNVKYILNAKVLEDGEVAVIKKFHLEEKLLNNGSLAIEFMKVMSESFRRDQTRFRDLVMHGKKGALFSTLIRLSNSYGKKQSSGNIYIDIVLTNQELANFCGTSRESVNRLLNDLKRNHIISMKKGHIIIHDLNFLKKEINCENCPVVLCSIH
ncbi:cyclic nucleotide-binding domain-containing protein [Virgibacillus dakarensis]|uniref:Crp/Fnr family transcriptional regulator n=1 Tax=Lentibacillus populi TaxID=1827502 RepID=A0A9W5X512_9BACI|nr:MULTISPECIES: Crp/Fnr family transcriptional regulator [Bacillaceae]MBT2215404.1 Crp/Fnr family transcriptional regulator [Virgibacillus dakarensis]MTW85427.1 cyclic nucleotide-binding domain-containing protein [Virgibacillus dakarensis]GGB39919.1 Crp/Fnr family transcriptional regulator [Lentibacillus populi]